MVLETRKTRRMVAYRKREGVECVVLFWEGAFVNEKNVLYLERCGSCRSIYNSIMQLYTLNLDTALQCKNVLSKKPQACSPTKQCVNPTSALGQCCLQSLSWAVSSEPSLRIEPRSITVITVTLGCLNNCSSWGTFLSKSSGQRPRIW